MEKMNKRELLRKQVLELFARGLECTQSSLDNAVDIENINDEIILNQINSLKELRDSYPRLTKSINEDINVLMSQVNPTDIKQYNKVNFLIRNETENEMIEILHWLSIFENASLTEKQKQLLIDIVEGFSYEGKHKDYGFMINKIERAKEKKCMNDKRVFSEEQLRKLFIGYYSKENDYWNEYLDYNRKLDCYIKDVAESKRKGDYYRSLSLQHSIFPLELDKQMKEED